MWSRKSCDQIYERSESNPSPLPCPASLDRMNPADRIAIGGPKKSIGLNHAGWISRRAIRADDPDQVREIRQAALRIGVCQGSAAAGAVGARGRLARRAGAWRSFTSELADTDNCDASIPRP
jgi:hypothetical protein